MGHYLVMHITSHKQNAVLHLQELDVPGREQEISKWQLCNVSRAAMDVC
jgi:hypothetical protein